MVNLPAFTVQPLDTPETDLPYPIEDNVNPYGGNGRIDLTDPSNMNNHIEYDPESGKYFFYQRIGESIDYRNPTVMTFEEYMDYVSRNSREQYWKEIRTTDAMASDDAAGPDPFRPSIKIESDAFDRIFGGNTVDIRPQGTAELTFGANINRVDNPQLPESQRSITTFNFDQRIQLNVVGHIGEKLKLSTSYNTEATFDFENQTKIEYTGYEDEIIKKIEAGNVSLPLNNSLISGSQSLFGIKTELQFGRLRATAILSQERGQKKEINVEGGAQTQEYEISIDNYEANKHYFLSHFFRDQYNKALKSLPVVNSQVQITRIEVWVLNQSAAVEETRNVIGFTDLGEDITNVNPDLIEDYNGTIGDNPINRFPDNSQNSLYSDLAARPQIRGYNQSSQALSNLGLQNARDFERLSNARQLNPNEYTYNAKLGFISLNQALNNSEVLAVAYQYTLNGQTYQVGDFSTDGYSAPDALYLKLLKSTIVDVTNPLWDLMMKNVYSLGAYQVTATDFILNIWYNDPNEGVDVPVIPQLGIQDEPLLQVFGLDKLDQSSNPQPDGRFDFVDNAATEGGTINSQNGRIYFPVVEPFGKMLADSLAANGIPQSIIEEIAYPQLYDSTKTVAQTEFLNLNRFKLRGSYQSQSSDEISLNALNIPQGAVQVTAGGVALVENQDYTVDYNLGRVKILNTGLLESQTPIKISVESNTLFSIQTRRLMGSRFDYRVNENLNVGATILNLNEKPLTQKVNIGDEPMNNTLWGLDLQYQTESRFLTDLVDAIPFIDTKETSTVDAVFEFAHLIPGHNKAVGKSGSAYIDDFEGTVSTIDLRNWPAWGIASIPQHQPELFPEASFTDSIAASFNRSLINWYMIDQVFFMNNSNTPDNINPELHFQRQVTENEVFPEKELTAGTPANISTFDLSFYPKERGPYNYDVTPTSVSSGVDPQTGDLSDPESRWSGVQRPLTTTDFEQTNIEFVQFWVMDPYNEDNRQYVGTSGNGNGALYINLGNVSEDVLMDGRMSFENGLPLDPNNPDGVLTDTTNLARVPVTQSVVNAFDNTTNSRATQDVGYDGFDDNGERAFFSNFLAEMTAIGVAPEVIARAQADPSSDNYHYFRGGDYNSQQVDILQRYKRYNGFEGNSVTSSDSPEDYPTQSTTAPTTEDINQDLTLSEAESYYQYKINLPDPQLNPSAWTVGNNYITDIREGVSPVDGRSVKWYQFKVPVKDGEAINNIQNLRSVRFMRMYLKGFSTPVVLRFARIELIRGEWRKYTQSLRDDTPIPNPQPGQTSFDVLSVNIEENSRRIPINYVTPPGISREIDAGSANMRSLNEQSLVLRTRNLGDGNARAAYRSMDVDMRMYGNLEMYIHGETLDQMNPVEYGDVTVFVRLGTDFNQNYYEYEVPLTPTSWNASPTPQNVWPEENNMVIDFDLLQELKTERNQSGVSDNQEFTKMDGTRVVKVRGNPVLSSVRTIMIGIRNPARADNFWALDNGSPQSVEVWVNELRLTDFNDEGGWAAVGRVNAQLADFGNISVSGNVSTPGFGSLQSRVSDRQQERIMGVNATSNLQLGKFLPEESGVKIPLFLGYAETVSIPKYDPLSPDLEMDEVTKNLTREERKEVLKRSQTYTQQRSINLTNVRKERTDPSKKPKIYDIENFNATVAYSDRHYYDINTAFNNQRQYRVGLGYNFQLKPTPIKPFDQVPLFRKSNYFALLRDFNFNVVPRNFSFRSDINRTYNELQYKNNNSVYNFEQPTVYTKTFNWTRAYNLQYDFSNSLRFTYTANNLAMIGEPPGIVDRDDASYNFYRDSVWQSISEFGINMNFSQTLNATYQIPINKIPILDWISADARYAGSYNWTRAPLAQDTLGNTIQNSRNIGLNTQFNFLGLYNKIPYLKKVNQKLAQQNRTRSRTAGRNTASGASRGGQDEEEEKDENALSPLDYGAKLLMSLKSVSVLYSQNEGILLPGYNQYTTILGMNSGFSAPGIGFVFGNQIPNFNYEAARRGWLVENPYLNTQYVTTYTEDFSARVSLEPLPGMRVELNASRTEGINDGSFFRWVEELQNFKEESPFTTGNLNMTMNALSTFFDDATSGEDNTSKTFETFLQMRDEVSNRLAVETGYTEPNSLIVDDVRFADGFGPTSQQVIIPSFIAAYTGQSAEDVKLNVRSYGIGDALKNPNWTVNYDGLSKVKFLKKWFKSITLGHAYRSTLSINNYTTNLSAGMEDGKPYRDNSEEANFIPEVQISNLTISEGLSPLLRIGMTWQNSLTTNFEINKTRILAFSLGNYQLTENKSHEIVMGLGYRFPNVELKIGGKTRTSDLNVRADLSIRDTEVISRRMQEGTSLISSGQKIISIKTAVDYVISERINIRAFYDHQLSTPKVSTSYPTSNIDAGVSLRFTLTQ